MLHFSFSGPGVLMCSIDNMPAQLPRESTEFFGGLLFPHIHDIVRLFLSQFLQSLENSYVTLNRAH